MAENKLSPMLLVRKLEGQLKRRDKIVAQLRSNLAIRIREIVTLEREKEEGNKKMNQLRKLLSSFLFQGPDFEDAVKDLVREHIEEERRRDAEAY